MTVAIVTDSTAYLPEDLIAGFDLAVVPLHVACDDVEYTEGVDLSRDELVALMRKGRTLTTSRPSPIVLYETYEALAAAGASHIVSAHLSAELSGTCDAAHLAADAAAVDVTVVDTRTIGMALGLAVRSGLEAAAAGASGPAVADVIAARARASSTLFYVHTLEFLRKGGRIGAAAAFLGSALSVKPLLAVVDGRIEPVEKLRTTGRAVTRLEDLAVAEAARAGRDVDVVVHHLDAEPAARRLADRLRDRMAGQLAPDSPRVVEIGAVAGAHLGPGTLAVVVAPRP